MYHQYQCTKCVPLMPQIKFGPCQSCYDTRAVVHFVSPPRFHLTCISQGCNSLPISLRSHIKLLLERSLMLHTNAYFCMNDVFVCVL